jgi:four helix bundle protein
LEVYRAAMDAAMEVFRATRSFPKEEVYSLTSQVLRSSRSVYANIVEAWRKRRYEAAFVSKLSDAEAEAAETQAHIECAVKCGYMTRREGIELFRRYDRIVRTLVGMIHHADRWAIPNGQSRKP